MSREFAEKIIDSMVDENGHCGERGLSAKQFTILSECLDLAEEYDAGGWSGDYAFISFWGKDYEGNIGKYHVVITEFKHFNLRFTVKSIDLRDADEYQAELEAEAKLKAMRDFSGSEWVSEPKKRIDLVLTLVNDYVYESCGYSYYDDGERHIYTLRDEAGNCYVWKTSNLLAYRDAETSLNDVIAEIGDRVEMKATVKEHSEYKGAKQTVITRPKVNRIEKVA